MPTNNDRTGQVIHVERWRRRVPAVDQAMDFCRNLTGLERALRAAGYDIAADLVSTAGIAVVRKMSADSENR